MTQNPINALKITIYNTKHPNTFQKKQNGKSFKKTYLSKRKVRNDQRCMLRFIAFFIIMYILYIHYV